MRITLKLFANLREYLPPGSHHGRVELDIAGDTTLADLIGRYRLPPKLVQLVLLNGHYIEGDKLATTHLKEGDVLSIWPPIAGG